MSRDGGRGSHRGYFSIRGGEVFLLVLCVSILFQMLGTPATLADPVGTDDLVKGLILTGHTVPSISERHLDPQGRYAQHSFAHASESYLSLARRFIRPPPAYSLYL